MAVNAQSSPKGNRTSRRHVLGWSTIAIASFAFTGRTAAAKNDKSPPYVPWRTLIFGYDLKRARASKKVRALHGTRVEIRGYMIPLEETDKGVFEFIIVSTQPSCEHVPPPPLNALVHAKASKGVPFLFGPMVVVGALAVTEGKAIQMEAPYQLAVETATNYRRGARADDARRRRREDAAHE